MSMVEWKTLGEIEDAGILELGRGMIISKNDMRDNPGEYPVYSSSSQGDGEIGRYGRYMFDDERITWSIDGGGKLFYRNNLKYSVTNVGGWLKVHKTDVYSTKFLYYLLSNQWTRKVFDYTHKAHPSVIRNEYQIPNLSPSEQSRIVSILDTFTASIANLKEQIGERRKQYEHYRNQLLQLKGKEGVEMKTLKDIFEVRNGYTPSTKNNEFWEDGVIPWFKMEDIRDNGRILSDSNLHITPQAVKKSGLFKANSILLATSATIGEHALVLVDHLSNQRFTNFYPKKEYESLVNMKFYYYYMFLIDEWCKQHVHQGGFASVDMEGLYKLEIPLPTPEKQSRIVSILDQFEASIANLEAQLQEREKQYEHYRNQLLTFE